MPGFFVHGIFQARTLEWVAISYSRRCSQPRDRTSHASPALAVRLHACMHARSLQLCLTLCDPMDCSPPGSSVHGDSLVKNTGVGCHALL